MFWDRLARLLTRGEWLLLALLLPPVILARPLSAPFLLLLPLLWLARRRVTGHFFPPTPLDLPVLLLLLMLLVSMWATFDLTFSFPKVAGLLYGVAVYYATVAAVQQKRHRLWLAVAVHLGFGLAVAALGVVAAEWSQQLPLPTPLAQVRNTLLEWLPGPETGINPNEIAGVLLWMTPMLLVLTIVAIARAHDLRARLTGPTFVAVVAVLAMLALLLTGVLLLARSRAALLGLAAGLLLAITVAAGRNRRFLIAGLLLLTLGGSVLLLIQGAAPLLTLLQMPAFASGGIAINSWEGRLEIWSRALYGISDFPLTGMGMGTFRRVVHILYPLFLISPERDLGHAHNHLLQTALDLGIPGLVAYLALWFVVAALLWRTWQQAPSPWLRALATGAAASLGAYFVYGLLDTVALGARPGFLFWLLLGIVAGAYRHATPAASGSSAERTQTPKGM